jgi:hypothetical protein
MVLHECYVNDLHTTTCSGMLGHHTHEVLQSVHSSQKVGLVLKLDYKKAFDKVDLDFLEELLTKRGFCSTWIRMISQICLCKTQRH